MKCLRIIILAILYWPSFTVSISTEKQLYRASKTGDINTVKILLAQGPNLNWRDADDQDKTFLHAAAENNHGDIVTQLIQNGAQLELKTSKEWTALHLAAEKNAIDALQALVRSGAQIDATGDREFTPLHVAAAHNAVESIKLLVEAGANLVARDTKWGDVPLHVAAEFDAADAVPALIQAGTDVHEPTTGGFMALHIAAEYDSLNAVETLVKNGANLDFQDDRFGWSAMILAARQNKSAAINLLINLGADINLADKKGQTAIDYAKQKGFTKVINDIEGWKVHTELRTWLPGRVALWVMAAMLSIFIIVLSLRL